MIGKTATQLVLGINMLAMAAAMLSAQSSKIAQATPGAPLAASSATRNPAKHAHARRVKVANHAAVAVVAPPPPPPAPVMPHWPVNDTPTPAKVAWNSQGLSIDATNSSLSQILSEVSTDTGLKVEGLGSDQRVYGAYGPGTAREVLAKLLYGSGYNVLMIGEQGAGTPRQIVLTVKNNAPRTQAPTPVPTPEDDSADTTADTVADDPPTPEAPIRPAQNANQPRPPLPNGQPAQQTDPTQTVPQQSQPQ